VLDAKQEFEQASQLVKSEVARFEQERIEDFKKSLEDLLDGMIARQETIQAQKAFEQVLLKKMPRDQRKLDHVYSIGAKYFHRSHVLVFSIINLVVHRLARLKP
jgi:hypothetical protein